jgi:hypothetical protein
MGRSHTLRNLGGTDTCVERRPRWARSFPRLPPGPRRRRLSAFECALEGGAIPKASLDLFGACVPRRAWRGSAPRSCLYFVGYVTEYAGSNLLARALSLSTLPHTYAAPQRVVDPSHAARGLRRHTRASLGRSMQDPASEVRKICLPRTSVNNGKRKGLKLESTPALSMCVMAYRTWAWILSFHPFLILPALCLQSSET